MPRLTHLAIALLAAAAATLSTTATAQQITDVEVTPQREAAFRQERALAYMAELEDRMYRLAELIRAAQPQDASRLTLAVQTSREALLTERMKRITTLLEGLELENAEATQQAVLDELEELKRLLLTADLDLELKLRELDAIERALQQLTEVEARERRQRDQTGELQEKDPGQAARLAELLEADERRNQRAAEDLAETLRSTGGAAEAASAAVQKSGEAMGDAAQHLDGAEADEAAADQDEALQRLAEARQHLQERQEALEQEVQQLARRRVLENLQAMLDQQTDISRVLEGLLTGLDGASEDAMAAAVPAVQRLAGPQDELVILANQTIDLAVKADFSIALPAALGLTRDRMVVLGDDLRLGAAEDATLAESRAVEAELEELLGAMRLADQQPRNRQAGEQGDRAREQEKKFNAIAAELRMLKMMQEGVNRRTAELDGARQAERIKPAEVRVRSDALQQLQDAVREATLKLDTMMKEAQP